MTALTRAKRVLTLIDLAFVCHFFLFIVRAIGEADTKVHFRAANSVTLAFIIVIAAAWTQVVKVLIDLAHVFWVRAGSVVLFLFFIILVVFTLRLTMAPAPEGTISEAFTLVIMIAFVRPERVQFFIATTLGLNAFRFLGVASLDIHLLDVGVHS